MPEEGLAAGSTKLATFAGGCFWCMVQPFENLKGVLKVVAGYTGGATEAPTYHEVCTGRTGHYEAVQVTYDPAKISYEELLQVFWKQIDPTDSEGQFADRGPQYRTAIFYHDQEQKELAILSKKKIDSLGLSPVPIATKILAAQRFYPAEECHQDYHKKNPTHYQAYKKGSGRESYINEVWSRINFDYPLPREDDLKKLLTPCNIR